MDAILDFYGNYGLSLTIFAVVGIILLGIMKYANLFKKLEERVRHILYVLISVAFSVLFALIHMWFSNAVDFQALYIFATNVFVLNQTFYNIFKVTALKDLMKIILDKFFKVFGE